MANNLEGWTVDRFGVIQCAEAFRRQGEYTHVYLETSRGVEVPVRIGNQSHVYPGLLFFLNPEWASECARRRTLVHASELRDVLSYTQERLDCAIDRLEALK